MSYRLLCLMFSLAFVLVARADASYLERTRAALAACGKDMPAITAAAEALAEKMAKGGKFWAGGHPALVSEFSGRAAGFMYLKSLQPDQVQSGDAILYAPGGLDRATELEALAKTGAALVCIGGEPPSGAHHLATASDLSATLGGAIAGWTLLAETVAALTRHGKMPVIYETIGLYGGFQRIAQFEAKGVYWHEPHTVPPIPPGTLGLVYTAQLDAMLDRVGREMAPRIAQVAAWSAESLAEGRRAIMYNMGHLFPNEVAETEIATLFESAVLYSGFSQMPMPEDTYQAGDTLIHIGYQHPPYDLLPRGRDAGARVAYVDLMQHRDYPNGGDVIWIDPMWDWADGAVKIPNYDVPACPASGVINSAIAWEIFRLTKAARDAGAAR